jgi:2,4-dienoyl-CoA reductase-like NADH-dependent reductase (Old Yellow Enzyme family)/thioredoxin reductase
MDILFEPLVMNNLKLKNRLFMAPMGTGYPISQLIHFLTARSKADVALITTGVISIHPFGRSGLVNDLRLENDADIAAFIPLVKKVKKEGAKIAAQLSHAGRYSFGKKGGFQPVAPSPIVSRYTGEMPRELSEAEVDDLVAAFARAALRAREAGFDGIEICGSSGYLISQFLSPVTNKRMDRYGGDAARRASFLISILKETRKTVGNDFNICVKLDGEDGVKGGRRLTDTLLIAPQLVQAGADRLNIWAGWHESARPMLPMSVPRGAFVHLAAAVKAVVDVPVATAGRINDPSVAAEILKAGRADLIGLGRALLCDPEFVKKTKEGCVSQIRRCTACCHCFDMRMKNARGDESAELKCSINPELGREGEGLIKPAEKRKNVLIVGGGPAGLEASRVAALRGHNVTLLEKESRIGGMLNAAVVPPNKQELKNILDYYRNQMKKLQVNIVYNESVSKSILEKIKPDTIILATGSCPVIPRIPGVHKRHVVSALEVLNGNGEIGEEVAIIGGGMIGLETAEYLADKGKKITVFEALRSIGKDIGPSARWSFLYRVKRKMKIFTFAKVVEIKDRGIRIKGMDSEYPVDTVVLATGMRIRNELSDVLIKMKIEFNEIGSCRVPGQIFNAISEGHEIGRAI